MKIFDISRTISPEIAVWPGDQKFEVAWNALLANGASVNLGSIKLSTHTGTHADAPFHYIDNGASVSELDLSRYIGPVLVVEVQNAEYIKVDHVRNIDFSSVKKILFKTKSSALADNVWIDDVVYLGTETAEFLGKKSVELVGLDGPSMDPVNSKTLETHKMLAKYGIVNLENVSLKNITPGEYELIALPLKLMGLDASPVRAVLIKR